MKKLILLLLIINTSFVWAQDTLVINSEDKEISLYESNFQFFTDKNGTLSFEEIKTKPFHKIEESDTIIESDKNLWLKITILNKTDNSSFHFNLHYLKYTLYQEINQRVIIHKYSAFSGQFINNDIKVKIANSVRFNINPYQTENIYIKIGNYFFNEKTLGVVKPAGTEYSGFLKHHFLYGIIIGAILFFAVYFFILFAINRKKIDFLFGLYIFLLFTYFVINSGLLIEMLPAKYLNESLIGFLHRFSKFGVRLFFVPYVFMLFSQLYLDLDKNIKWWKYIRKLSNILFLLFLTSFTIASYFTKSKDFDLYIIPLAIVSVIFWLIYLLLIPISIKLVIKKNKNAINFIIANILLVIGLFPFFSYNLEIAALLQIIIFSIGLSQKYKNIEKERIKQLEINNNLIKDANIKLEVKVKERTQEIQEANEELNQQNEEIIAQRDEIESQRNTVVKQKEKIEEIHHEVSESINYATRLQEAILPEEKILSKYVSEHFVLFKPKDKVSGDFYWWTHIENHTVITAADCTGHGVPGAFMSMLGTSFLREIVQKEYITHTGVILRKLRKEIIKALKQTGEAGTQKDGMDMAIISINHETNTVQFSGANNPLYIIRNEELRIENEESRSSVKEFVILNEAKRSEKSLDDQSRSFAKTQDDNSKFLYEVKPDKMPIAIYEKMDAFTTHEIQLEKGDQLYMFSDGFADQFGGPKGKKFKYKPFKRLLLENADKPMTEQKEILNQAFKEWKGDLEQIDDVVVLGVKI